MIGCTSTLHVHKLASSPSLLGCTLPLGHSKSMRFSGPVLTFRGAAVPQAGERTVGQGPQTRAPQKQLQDQKYTRTSHDTCSGTEQHALSIKRRPAARVWPVRTAAPTLKSRDKAKELGSAQQPAAQGSSQQCFPCPEGERRRTGLAAGSPPQHRQARQVCTSQDLWQPEEAATAAVRWAPQLQLILYWGWGLGLGCAALC